MYQVRGPAFVAGGVQEKVQVFVPLAFLWAMYLRVLLLICWMVFGSVVLSV